MGIGRTNAVIGQGGGGGGIYKDISLHGAPSEIITATDVFTEEVVGTAELNTSGDGVISLRTNNTYNLIGSKGNYTVLSAVKDDTEDINVYDEQYDYWYGREIVPPYNIAPHMTAYNAPTGYQVSGNISGSYNTDYLLFNYDTLLNTGKPQGREFTSSSYYNNAETILMFTQPVLVKKVNVYINSLIIKYANAYFRIYVSSGSSRYEGTVVYKNFPNTGGYSVYDTIYEYELDKEMETKSVSYLINYYSAITATYRNTKYGDGIGIFGYAAGKYKI